MGKDLWLGIINDDNCEESMITFQEYMLSLEQQNDGFMVTFLKSDKWRLTGCMVNCHHEGQF